MSNLFAGNASVAFPFHKTAPHGDIVVWLTRLANGVANPPGAKQFQDHCELMIEVCGDFPKEVWCPETRMAWFRQGRDNSGRLPGKFWPTPAELYSHLKDFADHVPAAGKVAYEAACREWARNDFAGDKPRICDFGGK